jgi:hypothetical protein
LKFLDQGLNKLHQEFVKFQVYISICVVNIDENFFMLQMTKNKLFFALTCIEVSILLYQVVIQHFFPLSVSRFSDHNKSYNLNILVVLFIMFFYACTHLLKNSIRFRIYFHADNIVKFKLLNYVMKFNTYLYIKFQT